MVVSPARARGRREVIARDGSLRTRRNWVGFHLIGSVYRGAAQHRQQRDVTAPDDDAAAAQCTTSRSDAWWAGM